MLTPTNSGASQVACNIINNTFLSMDGFEPLRRQMNETDYKAEHFAAELARVADREIGLDLEAQTAPLNEMTKIQQLEETVRRIEEELAKVKQQSQAQADPEWVKWAKLGHLGA